MSGWRLLTLTEIEPTIVIGELALLVAYAWAWRFRPSRRLWFGVGGVLLMAWTLMGPLDVLGDDYLFSAHMLEHMLLDFVVPPLLIAGLPADRMRALLDWAPACRLERFLSRPLVALIAGVGTLWLWHVPALYDAAVFNETIHAFEHLAFMVTGSVLFWPVFSPLPERRLRAPQALFLLFAAAFANSLLGILLTFAPLGVYQAYLHPDDELGLLPLLRDRWGIGALFDQQLGGLFMWVLGGVILLSVVLVVMARWFAAEPARDPAPLAVKGEVG